MTESALLVALAALTVREWYGGFAEKCPPESDSPGQVFEIAFNRLDLGGSTVDTQLTGILHSHGFACDDCQPERLLREGSGDALKNDLCAIPDSFCQVAWFD